MLELLHSLKDQLNPNYEKIARTTNSSVYFEREKANFVKEIFRINFVDNDMRSIMRPRLMISKNLNQQIPSLLKTIKKF